MENCVEKLPENLKTVGISLDSIGIKNFAWRYDSFLEVVEYLVKQNCFILGGDVYFYKDGHLESTYDSWYINKNDFISKQALIELCKNKSISFVKKYKELNGNDYCYSIVIEPNCIN